MAITLRPNEADLKAIEQVKRQTRESTASKAIMSAVKLHPKLNDEIDELKSEVSTLKGKLHDILEALEEQQSAKNSINKFMEDNNSRDYYTY